MEVKKDIKNDLLNRREVSVLVETDKNPGFAEGAKLIADQFKADEENIMVENVNGKFGRNNFLITASIYTTKELKEEAVKRLTKPKKQAVAA